MSNVVDRISDHDDTELARKQAVGFKNNVIFDSLFQALSDRVTTYNQRHPQHFSTTAVAIRGGFVNGIQSSLSIEKNTDPKASLTLDFPINSGAMQMKLSAHTGNVHGNINLHITNDTPTYDFGGVKYSTEDFADLLCVQVLSPTEPLAERRKIGFV